MTIPGLVQVQDRIAALQGRFAMLAPAARAASAAPAVPGSTAVRPATGATQLSFAATLDELLVPTSGSARADTTGSGTRPTPTGPDVVGLARSFLGVRYQWGGEDRATGVDCSGLVGCVYDELGIDLPRVSRDQARAGRPVADLRAARPGDLLFFGAPVDHVGIYTGDGKMIHAPRTGRVVSHERVYETPVAIRRVLPEAPLPSRPSAPAPAPAPAPTPAPAPRAAGLRAGVPYGDLFRAAAARHGLDPALLAGLAKVESGYNSRAVSPAGARGLMQLMPGTAAELGVDPLDPAEAVSGAARLIKGHLRSFGSLELALAAYNAGPGAVRRFGGIPPYAETRAYVPKVLAAMAEVRS